MGKISIWKKIVSYFREVHIESAPGEMHDHLYVSLKKGRFMLSTDDAIYSFGDLYTVFKTVFHQSPLQNLQGNKALILGFGLGSIPQILEKMNIQMGYVGVELDPNVIYLASKYGLPSIKSPVHLYEADAINYIKQEQDNAYSLICVDVFQGAGIPNAINSPAFFKELERVLKEKGLLFFNTPAPKITEEDPHTPIYLPIHKSLEQRFQQGDFIHTPSQWVFSWKKGSA